MRQEASERNDGSLLTESLRWVTHFVSQRPKLTLSLVALLAFASIVFTVCFIGFKTERADLIDPEAAFHQRWISYTESFGDATDIVVVLEAENSETIKQVLDELGARMTRDTEPFTNVLYKVEPNRLRQRGLQFLSPAQLETALNRLKGFRPVSQGHWDRIRLDSVLDSLYYQFQDRRKRASPQKWSPLLHQTELLTASLSRFLDDPHEFRSPWPEVVPVDPWLRDEADHAIYFLNDQGTMGFLKAFPVKDSSDSAGESTSIDRLRTIIDEVAEIHPTVQIGMTGIPVLEHDEMQRSKSDMLKASVLSFVGVGLILFLGFRGFRHPLLALLMLAVGMAWTFGYTTLSIGHLNILSVSFAVILIGLGIDFGIHYLARYLELRHEGKSMQPALLQTSTSVGTGIVTAAVTTALAFFCATFTEFLGVAELGIIAGGGILLCGIATFVVLPALVSLADRNLEPQKLPTPFKATGLRLLTSKYPLVVTLISMAVMVGIGSQAFQANEGRIELRVKYDYNLLNLQAEGLESVKVQKRVFQEADNSLLFAVSVAETPQEARTLRAKFEALPSVHHVVELASRLPASPHRETELMVKAIRAELSQLPRRAPRLQISDPAVVGRAMEQLYQVVRHSRDSVAVKIAQTIDSFLDRFESLSLHDQTSFLNAYQHRITRSLYRQFQTLAAASNPKPVTLADLPQELTSRFVSPEGKWLLQVYPKDEIWDVEPLRKFISEVRTVDPNVTGTPLQNFEAARQIRESYEAAALYALAVICLVLLVDFLGHEYKLLTLLPPLAVIVFTAVTLHTRRAEIHPEVLVMAYIGMAGAIAVILDFRNLRDAVLAMLPPLAGGILMFGMLGMLNIDLNPANLIVLPLVLGIGVDDGVHVIHDFRNQTGRYRTSSSTINAIVLTSLTSMIGFGSMMVAAHRGLSSVGLVLVIGVGSCLFISLVTLPAILTLLSRHPTAETVSNQESPRKETKPHPKAA